RAVDGPPRVGTPAPQIVSGALRREVHAGLGVSARRPSSFSWTSTVSRPVVEDLGVPQRTLHQPRMEDVIDRYAGEPFTCYAKLRRSSPAQTRAELEIFDDLVLMKGLRPGDAARWVVARSAEVSPAHLGLGCVPPNWL